MPRLRPAVAVAAVLAATLSGCSGGSRTAAGGHHSSSGTGSPVASAAAGPSTPASAGAGSSGSGGAPSLSVRVARWRLPAPLSREAAMAYGGRLLVAGGLEPGDVTTGRVWRIDPDSGKAHRLPDLAAPVHDVAGGVVGGRPTLVGGGSATSLSVVQQSDGAGHWKVVAHLPTARSDVSAVTVPGGLVAVGGYDGVHLPRAVLRTTDGRHFRTIARLPHGVRYAGVAVLGGALWVLGGEESGQELREVWRVDLTSGRVTKVGRLPGPLGHEAVVPVAGRLLVLGGRTTSSTMTDRMWWFSPASGTWRKAGRLPYPLADAPAVQLGGTTYLVGGETPHFTRRVLRVTVH